MLFETTACHGGRKHLGGTVCSTSVGQLSQKRWHAMLRVAMSGSGRAAKKKQTRTPAVSLQCQDLLYHHGGGAVFLSLVLIS